ncbi:MAG: NAD-dependent epimerase/dehydratase family protein [bacterium]|nr:NAD-dependent epimerase/dehydratase family protein [bacterium]
MAILVTGATGFVGSHLITRLAAGGAPIRALVRRHDDSLATRGVDCIIGDLKNKAALVEATSGVETVYHLAAVTIGGSGDLWETNVDGTHRLMEACLSNKVRRVIFVSSASAYRAPLVGPIDESAPLGGVERYGQSKAAAETAVRDAGRGRMETVILRPCQVYGSNDRTGYTGRLLRAVAGRYVPAARGSARFSLVHVDDVIDALELAAAVPADGPGVFNIAGPGQTSLSELGGEGTERRFAIPKWVLQSALSGRWLVWAIRNPNVRPPWRSYAPSTLHGSMWLGGPEYDTSRARTVLGFVPKVDHSKGLHQVLVQNTAPD